MYKTINYIKLLGIFILFQLLAFNVMSQSKDAVTIEPKHNQSEATMRADKDQCFENVENQLDQTKHKTIKNTAGGAAGGAIIGEIFDKPGIGAVLGGGAGAYRGHKKSKGDKRDFNEVYASCLREKGYSVEIHN